MPTLFDKSQKGQRSYSIPYSDKCFSKYIPKEHFLRKEPLLLPELSEIDLTRHFNELASKNWGIDSHFYPLGSCTMKLNPRVNEEAARLKNFNNSHPLAKDELVQGNLELLHALGVTLMAITGMESATLNVNAGAQGEFVGVKMIMAYHLAKGDLERIEMLIPANAHGTNPATAAMVGFKTIELKTDADGDIDLEDLKKHLSSKTAGLMLTNPNTLGLFSRNILTVSKLVHEAGGLLYYDGANLNPLLGIVKPKDMGFDVMHINLHKTFSTPHGGGGPGAGPVLCVKALEPYLPVPKVVKEGEKFVLSNEGDLSIGRISTFQGNFAILLRAYLYSKLLGSAGLRKVALHSVLNANYLKKQMEKLFFIPYPRHCMHEFVVQADRFLNEGITAYDLVKRLIDYGIHPPTVYFPLIVKQAILIEPTECESLDTLKSFIAAMEKIVQEAENDPSIIKEAPHSQSVSRIDEVQAAKKTHLTHFDT